MALAVCRICAAEVPRCSECPLARGCVAKKTGQAGVIPFRPKRKPAPHYDIAACVIRRGDKVLISQRRAHQMLGGLWEFPGGKRLPGEALEETARRELREEMGIEIRVGTCLCVVKHAYSHFRITLYAFDCRHVSGRPSALASDQVRWVPVRRLREYPFPAADREIIDRLCPAG